jgi:hypothetical protein
MPISGKQRDKVIESLRQQGVTGRCSACGNENWILPDWVTHVSVQEPSANLALGGQVMPCIPIVCSRCGNTLLFNLIVLGVWDEFQKDDMGKAKVEGRAR